jgi:hypothetical protein
MSVPQKVLEAPASALRAMFAGVGSLLSAVDKARGKSAAQAPAAASPAPAPAPTAAAAPEAAVPEATAEAEAVAEPAAVAAETATPGETPAAETVAAETVAAEEAAAPAEAAAPETVAPEASADLPLANYDESTVASLRARLRNLSVDQLTQLIEYEKGHAARADVITMFERRIAKIEAEA